MPECIEMHNVILTMCTSLILWNDIRYVCMGVCMHVCVHVCMALCLSQESSIHFPGQVLNDSQILMDI